MAVVFYLLSLSDFSFLMLLSSFLLFQLFLDCCRLFFKSFKGRFLLQVAFYVCYIDYRGPCFIIIIITSCLSSFVVLRSTRRLTLFSFCYSFRIFIMSFTRLLTYCVILSVSLFLLLLPFFSCRGPVV